VLDEALRRRLAPLRAHWRIGFGGNTSSEAGL